MTAKSGPDGSKNLKPGANRGKTVDPDKRARFVAEYLRDFNATRAAERAGYSVRSAGSTGSALLKNPDVQALLAAGKEKLRQKHEITADRVAQELACLGFSNSLDYVCVTGPNAGSLDLSSITREQAAAIQEISFGSNGKAKAKGKAKAGEMQITKIKLAPKREALADLAKYLGMFKDEGPQNLNVTFVLEGLEPRKAS